MRSRLIQGKVVHTRLSPRRHSFRYPVFFVRLALDELEALDSISPLFGVNKFRLLSIHEQDYLPEAEGSLSARVEEYLRREGCEQTPARVELLTMPRFLNRVFNPVSFYYCYDQNGVLFACLAEVKNTFGEKHIYVLNKKSERSKQLVAFDVRKAFHVSPFYDVSGDYRFSFAEDPVVTDVHGDIFKNGNLEFSSRLWGTPRLFNSKELVRMLVRQPLSISLTMPRILWEAGKLFFLKRLRVYTKPAPSSEHTVQAAPPRLRDKLGRKVLFGFLSRIENGSLEMHLPDGTVKRFVGSKPGYDAKLEIIDNRFFWRVATRGDAGFGESYTWGEWSSPDPTELLKLFLDNRNRMDDRDLSWASVGRVFNRIYHRLRSNSLKGSKGNIQAHYDLSNDFFKSFLDDSMTYSCALFAEEGDSLEIAQQQKIDVLLEKARIQRGHRILEIGSGWGALAITAAKRFGCSVTTITLSEEQKRLVEQRVAEAGLEDKVEVLLADYRSIQGEYDRIISVEMLEAVGHEFLPAFFKRCDELLKPDGLLVLQVITMPDDRYEEYLRGCDWIQRYIFPGAVVPSVSAISSAVNRSSGFLIEHLENIGTHYARTLKEWRDRFRRSVPLIEKLGFDSKFQRMWEYYLVYCEAGFATRTLGTHQLVLTRPNNKELESCPGY